MGLEMMTVGELEHRREVAHLLIKMLERDGDEVAKKAIANLQEQQRAINKVLVEKIRAERAERGEPEPEPVVVGLEPVVIRGRVLR